MQKIIIPKTKKIVLAALMLATFIILDRFVSINIQILAINFSSIAIMIVAIYCGPKYSTIVAVLGDLIAALLFPFGSYFIGFTITNLIMGLIFGLFLYEKPIDSDNTSQKSKTNFIVKAIISNILVLILVNLILNTYCIHFMYGKAFWVLFASRAIAQIIICVINTSLIIILEKVMRPFAKKYLYEKEEN